MVTTTESQKPSRAKRRQRKDRQKPSRAKRRQRKDRQTTTRRQRKDRQKPSRAKLFSKIKFYLIPGKI